VLDKAEYSAFESTLNFSIVSYRTSNVLARSLVILDHTVLPATDRGDSHAFTPGMLPCRYSFIDPGRMKD